jgi:hypothetical protein
MEQDYYFNFYLGLGRNVDILEGFLMPVLATLRTTAVSGSPLIVLGVSGMQVLLGPESL